MPQFCLYLRKSRADLELEAKGEMETLARHKKQLLELAKRMDLPITKIYEEIVSGETIDSRPVVQQLLDEVEQGSWSGVLVMEVERLARGDTIDQGIVARAFNLGRTKIITPAKVYDPENEFDEEYFEFGLFMSRREYKTINRRIQRGRVASAKEGKFLGSTPPYGYHKKRIPGDHGYSLEPYEPEAQIVKLIYDLYCGGTGMTALARHLDSMGVKPRSRDTWSKSTINDILSNPVYMGKLRWSYRIEKKYIESGKVGKRRTKNNNPILVDGLHKPIITPETFERAQIIRQNNVRKTTKSSLTLQNPLSGVIYCRKCGQLMTRLGPNKRNKYDTLRCPNQYCDNVSAPIMLVEQKIIQSLTAWLRAYTLSLKDNAPRADSGAVDAMHQTLKELKKEAEKIQLQISNTFDLLEQGIYTADVFTQRNKELAERREKLADQIAKTEQALEQDSRIRRLDLEQLPHMEKILASYQSLKSAEEKNAVLKTLLSRADYLKTAPNTRGNLYNDNFEIHIYPRLAADCELPL